MKAAVFEKKGIIKYEENYDYPKLRKDSIIIKVKSCAICGSDVHAYESETIPPPVVLGHEFSGEIFEIGEKVEGLNIGDRVIVQPHIRCGKCYYCQRNLKNLCVNSGGIGFTQDGGFAEYVRVMVKNHEIFMVPENIGNDHAALVETYSIAHRALRLSGIKDEKMVIIGAGAIGLFVLLAAKLFGIEDVMVIEPNKFNQKKALELGASQVFLPDDYHEIKKITSRVGPDFVFECVGSPNTYVQAFNLVRKGGTVVLIGIHDKPFEFNFFPLMLKELIIKTVTLSRPEDMQEILQILSEKNIDLNPFITKHIDLKELDDTFKWLSNPEREAIKIIIKF